MPFKTKEERRIYIQRYQRENIDKRRVWTQRYRRSSPEKARAHWTVSNALRGGRLVRPSNCSGCGTECTPQAHHEDYFKQLEVIWVCDPCHKEIHRKIGE